MSDHVIELLGAYLDGELRNGQRRRVENHLDACQECQEEYASLGALSELLIGTPAPEFPSVDRLAAEVALRLPRDPSPPMRRRAMEVGWWMIPVGLIAAWVFISTTFLVSNLFTAANNFGLLNSASVWLDSGSISVSNFTAYLGGLGLLEPEGLRWLISSENLTRNVVSSVFWQVALALFYLSWLAIWWAHHTREGLGQSLQG